MPQGLAQIRRVAVIAALCAIAASWPPSGAALPTTARGVVGADRFGLAGAGRDRRPDRADRQGVERAAAGPARAPPAPGSAGQPRS